MADFNMTLEEAAKGGFRKVLEDHLEQVQNAATDIFMGLPGELEAEGEDIANQQQSEADANYIRWVTRQYKAQPVKDEDGARGVAITHPHPQAAINIEQGTGRIPPTHLLENKIRDAMQGSPKTESKIMKMYGVRKK